MRILADATVARKIESEYYPVRKLVNISIKTSLFSKKIIVHKLRGKDNDLPQTKIVFKDLQDFLTHFKEIKNVRKDIF